MTNKEAIIIKALRTKKGIEALRQILLRPIGKKALEKYIMAQNIKNYKDFLKPKKQKEFKI
jgi:hypothetical protein